MPTLHYRRDTAEFDRGLSFFDAIYAFAITLLITTVHLPPARAWHSPHQLIDSGLMPQLFGFTLSFLVIASFWRRNYQLIGTMKAIDPVVISANVLCVFFVVLITFTTQGLNAPGLSNLPLPTSLYAANIALASLSQTVMFSLAGSRGLTTEPQVPRTVQTRKVLAKLVLPTVFLTSIPIAYLLSVNTAQFWWASLIVLAPIAKLTHAKHRPPRNPSANARNQQHGHSLQRAPMPKLGRASTPHRPRPPHPRGSIRASWPHTATPTGPPPRPPLPSPSTSCQQASPPCSPS